MAFGDGGGVTVWSAEDGAFVDRIECPGRGVDGQVAFSPNGRWIVLSTFAENLGENRERPVTCIIDRTSRRARTVEGIAAGALGVRLRFSPDGDSAFMVGRTLDLAAGSWRTEGGDDGGVDVRRRFAVRRDGRGVSVYNLADGRKVGGVDDVSGAQEFAISSDGARIAGWTPSVKILLGGGGEAQAPPRPSFLAMWDVASGRQVWRDDERCCTAWVFAAGDEFLEAGPGQLTYEILRADTGEPIRFGNPGSSRYVAHGRRPQPIGPDGRRLLVSAPEGVELWALDPPRPIVAPQRPRLVLARSPDGTSAAALTTDETLVLERADRCVSLGVALDVARRFQLAFSADGAYLQAALERKQSFSMWRTDTGEVVRTLASEREGSVYLMPTAGKVGFAVRNGIRVYDALTGRELAVTKAPRLSYSRRNGQGWHVRDHDGDQAGLLGLPAVATRDGRYLVGRSPALAAVSVWDLQDPRAVLDLGVDRGDGPVALSPDDRFIAAGTRTAEVDLWTRDGHKIPTSVQHDRWVWRLAFSPDGSRLVTSTRGGDLHLIDTATGAEVAKADLVADSPVTLSWSPDSRRVIVDTARRFRIELAR